MEDENHTGTNGTAVHHEDHDDVPPPEPSTSSPDFANGRVDSGDSGASTLNGEEEEEEESNRLIELIIKASTIDGRRKGACIFCQEYFMDLYLLAELKTITLKVTTVDMSRPPKDFRAMFDSTNPPILVDGDQIVLENEKIERYIMKSIPGGHNLFVSDKATSDVIENIYTKFKLMMSKNDEHSHANFRSLLQRIDEHLAKRKTRYLTGDTLVCFDCELMSRLQHIRIAGKYFCQFEIPAEFEHLWAYMYHMYNLEAFRVSCPADQDIINHYKLKQRVKIAAREELEEPSMSTSVPDNVLALIEEQQQAQQA